MTARDLSKHALETANGKYVDLLDPDPADLDVKDIAWALSMTCRFGGHVARYYSVAEHAVLVALLLRADTTYGASSLPFYGLHHDDHEAFLCDIPTPLKNLLGPAYDGARLRLDRAIADLLGIGDRGFHLPEVQWADAVALRLEAHALKASGGEGSHWAGAWERFDLGGPLTLMHVPPEFLGRVPWTPEQAYHEYLALHAQLS